MQEGQICPSKVLLDHCDELILCNLHVSVNIMLLEDLCDFLIRYLVSKFCESIFQIIHSDLTCSINIKLGKDRVYFLWR